MISKTFRIARMIVLASLALSSSAWGVTCSNASLSGTCGFLHDGTDSNGTPATAAVSQIAFDPTTGTFTGETTASHDALGIAASLGTSFLFDDKSLLAVNTQRYIEYIFRGIVSPSGASKHNKNLVPLAHGSGNYGAVTNIPGYQT